MDLRDLALEEAATPIAWDMHPLAASGGQLMVQLILPHMGSNARDFARAAVVCRDWRVMVRQFRASTAVFREMRLALPHGAAIEWQSCAWSRDSRLLAVVVMAPFRAFVIEASTGAVLQALDLYRPMLFTSSTVAQQRRVAEAAFSRDGRQLLVTTPFASDYFAVHDLADGAPTAVHPRTRDDSLTGPMWGVPGSASDGLIAVCSHKEDTVDVWRLPSQQGGALQLVGHLADTGSSPSNEPFDASFSPDGDKLVVAYDSGLAIVYAVNTLTPVCSLTFEGRMKKDVTWTPDGQGLLMSYFDRSAVMWRWRNPEMSPSKLAVFVPPSDSLHGWSPDGSSYFTMGSPVRPPNVYHVAVSPFYERRAADGAVVRETHLRIDRGPSWHLWRIHLAPNARAIVMHPDSVDSASLHVFD